MAYIQETVAPQMMGKILSMFTVAMTWATPFGLFLAGPICETIDVELWFAVSGCLMMMAGAVCYFSTKKYNG